MSLITISKSNKIIVSIIATVLIFVGYYLSVYKSFSYQSKNDTIGNVMMIISIGLFPMLWLNIAENSKWKKYAYVMPMVIIGCVLVFVMITKKKEYLEEELNKYGQVVVGKVIGFEVEHTRRSKFDYATFKYEYEYENKQFIQKTENFDSEYRIDQILNLKISKRNPEMFKIIETEK
jgi:uncharacterized membrane protein